MLPSGRGANGLHDTVSLTSNRVFREHQMCHLPDGTDESLASSGLGMGNEQMRLPFGWPDRPESGGLEALDLFTGIGGIALGFQAAGFSVTGVDCEELSAATYEENAIGKHVLADLSEGRLVKGEFDVIVGGPPCRPWSAMNLQRRGESHEDYHLLEAFFRHIAELRPYVFLMENVPPVAGDKKYLELLTQLVTCGYSIDRRIIRYSDFGAATARRRLFTVGIRDSSSWTATDFFTSLAAQYSATAKTVKEAIGWLQHHQRGDFPDHEWSRLTSIGNYEERYRTGRFGWKQLLWNRPAPSFGSISKTYILHPESGVGDFPVRVLSVREVLSIMSFSRTFRFPESAPLGARYRMAANAVSPAVAEMCARIIRSILSGPLQYVS